MKYVIVKNNGCEVPHMFPDMVEHVMFRYNDPVSAGKFRISTNADNGELIYEVYGESTSLKLKHRPEDADIIRHAFEFEGA